MAEERKEILRIKSVGTDLTVTLATHLLSGVTTSYVVVSEGESSVVIEMADYDRMIEAVKHYRE